MSENDERKADEKARRRGVEAPVRGFVESGSARIAYEIAGSSPSAVSVPAAPSVVLVHAGVADLRMWDDQVPAFAERYRTVRYDVRGFGGSSMPPEPFAHFEDLKLVLDGLGIDRAFLVGVSMGGTVVLDFVLEYPERVAALVVCGASPSGTPATEDIKAGWAEVERLLEAGDVDGAIELELRMWVDGPLRRPEEVHPEVRERVRVMEVDAFARALTEPEGEEVRLEPAASGRLWEIEAPALVMVGDLDFPQKVEVAGEMAVRMPNASLVVIDGTAHVPNMEAPERFNRLVLGFLDSVVG